mgnify:CR=1 FL=1
MVSTRSRFLIGVLSVLGFVVLSDARDIYLEQHIKVENPFDYLLIVFGVTALFYATTSRVKALISPSAEKSKFTTDLAWLNLATASNWLGWYLSLRYLTAPTVVALYAGIIPMATLVVNRLLRSTSVTSRADWPSAILLLSCTMVWAFVNVQALEGSQAAMGLGLVVMCSFSIAATTVVSKRLADAQVPARRIMAHRFYLLLAIAFTASSPAAELLDVAWRNYQVLLATSAGTIVPLWLLQKGIERCEPVLTVVIIATSPAFSLALYFLLIGGASVQTDTVLMSMTVVAIAVSHTFVQHRHQTLRSNAA